MIGSARGDRPGHRELPRPETERLTTWATALTLVRTVAAVAVALDASRTSSLTLLVTALLVYWVGDMADGALARVRDEETRLGGVVDVLCDRLSAACVYLGFAWYDSATAVPVGLYLFAFLVVDTLLSLSFMAWPVNSPNYFYRVDERLWRWNWSKPAKAANSAVFAVLLVSTRNPWGCGAVAACLLVVKLASLHRLLALGLPVPVAVPDRVAAGSAAGGESPGEPGLQQGPALDRPGPAAPGPARRRNLPQRPSP